MTKGAEHLFEGGLALKRLYTFGFFMLPWQTMPYDENPAIGRFEGAYFDPSTWKPRVPTAAFLRARADDSFWAARRVIAFSDDMIRAMVEDRDVHRSKRREAARGRADPAPRQDRLTRI